METNHPKPHAIMVPLSLQGHVNPFTHLAMKLASNGFTITFVNTEYFHHQITKSKLNNTAQEQEQDDIFAAARETGLDIRYRTVSDGFPLSFNRFQNLDQSLEGAIHVFPAHIDELVGDLVQSDPSINCLIADTFHTWTAMIANKHNLINISFWTEPALVLNIYYHLDLLVKHGHFGCHDNCEDTIDYIPGVQAIEPKDLTSHLHITNTSDPMLRIVKKAFREAKRADFILCNTVQELEAESLSTLQDKQPTYAIGPVFPTEPTKSVVATNLMSEIDCTQWLKTKPQGSVLYVSFGSYCQVTKNEFEEIAQGLLLSKVSFIWVLRPDTISYEEEGYIVPFGFEDQISDRGLMVPWCSQIEVLSNPAIGGFLTHCGWNSILESMWFGVPMLCFPISTDQFTNRKLVVDDWRIGLNLCDRKPIARLEVAHKVNRLMNGNLGDGILQKEIKKAKQTLEDALSANGSSQQSLCQFINDVKAKIQTRI
ncbi:PREDICTED: UDP-glycosyltransferase 86A1-like [Fragaria vesca subsp. vesca]|uniref:UDP-glycosyltransferase 86A1-like n=1 Tax=Fragaria vesca subsp. vesca TaxID=101020 RepID=UPI0002C336AC|nr:PREDICTED: UDP-glycosyltransferase 86A1-like [Fragaria vesca subsp. vesca]